MRISPASKASKGVTLIEMMVVVAIIGLIVAVAAPSVSAGIDAVRMTSAADEVATFLNSAVNRSVRRQEPLELVISLKDNKLNLYSNDPNFNRELKMPEGIQVEAVLPKVQDDPEEARRLILMPGASVPGIGIQLANHRNGKRLIRLDPMTGFPRIQNVTGAE
jgi:prepilin-type N-terminal cleavage/methylation domain-containing protein